MMSSWPEETIPDADHLFMRVHKMWKRDDGISPGAFQNHNSGMSTDWSKYSTAEATRARAMKLELLYAVIQMKVGDVRMVPNQVVRHTPDVARNNRAHTDVIGDKKKEKIRVKLRRIAVLVLPWEP